tara:strand:- start:30 stop:692 length:663 start_codon:yes stop_codon:yes gene_type:complete
MKVNINNLQKKIGVKFKNTNLLKKSLTHKSFDAKNNYEKLEFLGDRVLGLIISKKLIDLFPYETEGSLDKKFASLVNKNRCCEVGKNIFLDNFILIGKPNTKTKIENKIISDCCEALIGAVYLDKGFYFVEKFILKLWDELIKSADVTLVDSKTRLQEFSLKKFKKLPIYKLVSNTGPKHKPNFKVAVKIKNTNFIEGNGTSIKKAQQNAAEELLKQIPF